jgi:hypothetical protein
MGGAATAVIAVAREDGRVLGSAVAVWFVSEKQGRVCVSEDDESKSKTRVIMSFPHGCFLQRLEGPSCDFREFLG